MPIHIQYQLQEGSGPQGEPLRVNQWELSIPFIGDDIHLWCNGAALPEQSVDKMTIRHFNQLANVAGQTQTEDGSVTVRDIVTPDVYDRFYRWWLLVYNPESGAIGFASEYKKRGFATRFDSKGNPVRTYELINLWPTKVPAGDFNYDSSDGVMLEVPLVCDRIRPL